MPARRLTDVEAARRYGVSATLLHLYCRKHYLRCEYGKFNRREFDTAYLDRALPQLRKFIRLRYHLVKSAQQRQRRRS